MSKRLDITGQRFGQLIAIKRDDDNSNGGRSKWICRCDCGQYKSISLGSLRGGYSKSCGCMQRQKTVVRNMTHGESKSRLYSIWCGMKRRCYAQNCKSYRNYGGRGIKVCDEWVDSFTAFMDWSMNNGYSDELTLDRINNNGNYSPDNCRWANYSQQVRNSRHTHYITVNGDTKCLADWAKYLGVDKRIISRWYKKGENILKQYIAVLKCLQNYAD